MSQREDYPRVDTQSLPMSLRHHTQQNAAEDAQKLVYLLDDINYFRAQAEDPVLDEKSEEGLRLLLKLIKDKLAIASGEYRFPMCGDNEDGVLAERVEL